MATIRLPKGADPQVIADRLERELALLYKGRYTGPMRVTKHYGPGDHPSGSSQKEHGRRGDTTEGRRLFSVNVDGEDSETVQPRTPAQAYGLPELPEGQHWVLDDKLPEVEKKVAALGRRAARRGLDKYELRTLDQHATYTKTTYDELGKNKTERVYTFTAVEVTGDPPKYPGFRFVAVLQHMQNEDDSVVNIIRQVPGSEDVTIPKEYYTAGSNCMVCDRDIYRRDTFLVEKDGDIVQCGRDCLKDYTGHQDPLAAADAITIWADLADTLADEDNWDVGRNAHYYPSTATWLTVVAAAIRVGGYVSAKAVHEGRASISTKDIALDAFAKPQLAQERWGIEVTDADRQMAADTIAYFDELDDEEVMRDQFTWNMTQAIRQRYVMPKTEGISAYGIVAYQKALGKEIEQKRRAAESDWVGAPGDKVDLPGLTVTGVWVDEGQYGATYQYDFVTDDGDVVRWRKSKEPVEVSTGWEADEELLTSYITSSQEQHDKAVEVREGQLVKLAEAKSEAERIAAEHVGETDPVLGDWPGPDQVPDELRDRLVPPRLPNRPEPPRLLTRDDVGHVEGSGFDELGETQADETIGGVPIDQVDFAAWRTEMHDRYRQAFEAELERLRSDKEAWLDKSEESTAALNTFFGKHPPRWSDQRYTLNAALRPLGLDMETVPVEAVTMRNGETTTKPAYQHVVPDMLDAEFDAWQAKVTERAAAVKARQAVISDPLYTKYRTWRNEAMPMRTAQNNAVGLENLIAKPIPEPLTREQAIERAKRDYETKAVRPLKVGDRIAIKKAPIAAQKGRRPGNDTYKGVKQTNLSGVRATNITFLGSDE
jgi:hypothetical protein